MSQPIITNKAIEKMKYFALGETQIIDVYNTGSQEEWTNKMGFNTVKKYSGYEVGVAYFTDDKGIVRITTVWKRERR